MLGLTGRPQWRTVTGGSRRYVEALTAPFADRIRLDTPVRAIERFEDRVEVDGERFDEVVIAAHADQALAMLADADAGRARDARRVPLPGQRGGPAHRPRLLPRRRRAWASWNYHLPRHARPGDRHLPHEPPAVAATPTASTA